jgi:hypothetical protein
MTILANGNGKGGFAVGFGVRLSTGGIIILSAGALTAMLLLHHHHKKKHHQRMMSMHHAFFGRETAADPQMEMRGGDNDMDDVNMKVFSHIMTNCREPMKAEGNVGSILRHIRSYEVYLRPLLEKKMSGHLSEREYHRRVKTVIDQIADDLDMPMHGRPHVIKPDLINHDGSTTDMDTGGMGWMSRKPHDKYRFKRHMALNDDGNEPEIQDFSARMNFAALSSIGTEDEHTIPLARANNVELADDYQFSHINYLTPVVAGVFE